MRAENSPRTFDIMDRMWGVASRGREDDEEGDRDDEGVVEDASDRDGVGNEGSEEVLNEVEVR